MAKNGLDQTGADFSNQPLLFENLKLMDVIFDKRKTLEQQDPLGALKTYYESLTQLEYQGRTVPLDCGIIEFHEAEKSPYEVEYHFTLGSPTQFIRAELTLKLRISTGAIIEGIATTNISRNNKTGEIDDLPKGLGIAFYRKMIEFIEAMAHEKNIPIRHIVSKAPGFGANTESSMKPLSEKRWDDLFLPLLNEYPYAKTTTARGDVGYVKVFNPNEDAKI